MLVLQNCISIALVYRITPVIMIIVVGIILMGLSDFEAQRLNISILFFSWILYLYIESAFGFMTLYGILPCHT